ncbi:MAG: glycosyltransferase family 39 protein [Verrucomicrobiota bacterium]|nr:glycosyltransferase family 39 protein [Verrucomicrobiota bacterium]MDD8050225.1 glycosyltransferase family 39 protein [Verrucomicrobiota bacterium]
MHESMRKPTYFMLIFLWMFTLVGIHSVPLETHEAFVLETARNMSESGDWIIPEFNGDLRLQKPPLNYWATILVSWLDWRHADIEIWHGRLVSMLGAMLMVLLTAQTSTKFFGAETGIFSALLLMSMQGFIHISNNARPDFFYSALGIMQLFFFADAWKANDRSWAQWAYSILGWASAGFATLAKGPQLPVMFLLGMLLFLFSSGERKRIRFILKPLPGMVLFILIVLPWWIALNQKLNMLNVDISDSQMSGSLLMQLAGWRDLLSFYYVRSLLVLALPAVLIIPMVIPRLKMVVKEKDGFSGLMVLSAVTILLLFSFGGQYRKHYILSLLPILAIFLARMLTFQPLADLNCKSQHRIIFVVLIVCGLILCLVLLFIKGLFSAAIILFFGAAFLTWHRKNEFKPFLTEVNPGSHDILWLQMMAILLIIGFDNAFPLKSDRAEDEKMAEFINDRIRPNDLLVEWESSTPVMPFLTRRNIPRFDQLDLFKAYVLENAENSGVLAILPYSELSRIQQNFELKRLYLRVPFSRVLINAKAGPLRF